MQRGRLRSQRCRSQVEGRRHRRAVRGLGPWCWRAGGWRGGREWTAVLLIGDLHESAEQHHKGDQHAGDGHAAALQLLSHRCASARGVRRKSVGRVGGTNQRGPCNVQRWPRGPGWSAAHAVGAFAACLMTGRRTAVTDHGTVASPAPRTTIGFTSSLHCSWLNSGRGRFVGSDQAATSWPGQRTTNALHRPATRWCSASSCTRSPVSNRAITRRCASHQHQDR